MTIDDCFQLGYIIKPHGLDGKVDIFIDSDFPESYRTMESVFVNLHEELVPFFVSVVRLHGNKATVKLEEVDTKDQALELKGKTLHLPISLLPPLAGNAFYFHEITEFQVIDQTLGKVGQVSEVYNYPNQDFIVIKKDEKEVLIPINDDIILRVDRKTRVIEVDLPDGLMDIYL